MLASIYPSATLSLRQRPCSRRRRSGIPRRAQSEDKPRRRLWVPISFGHRPTRAPHVVSFARNWGYDEDLPKSGREDSLEMLKVIGISRSGSKWVTGTSWDIRGGSDGEMDLRRAYLTAGEEVHHRRAKPARILCRSWQAERE